MLKRICLSIFISSLLALASFTVATTANSTPQAAAELHEGAQQPVRLSLNVARRGHTATALGDGRVIIIGGENQGGAVGEAELLDPTAQTVSIVSNLLTPRVNHSATLLPDGRVLVVGGSKEKESVRTTEIFDPQTNSFSRGPRLSIGRAGHTATALNDDYILIAGGGADGTAELFDINAGKFTLLTEKMNGPRGYHSALLVGSNAVLIAGGIGPDDSPLDTAEVFFTSSLSFKPIDSWMYSPRVQPDLRLLPDGKIQVIGGDEKGTMEMLDPRGKYFRGFATLIPTVKSMPPSAMLQARTRNAFISGARILSKQKIRLSSSALDGVPDISGELLYRSGLTSTEIPQLGLAVIAGGVDEKGQFLSSIELVRSVPSTLSTDLIDYPQGSSPVITGSGWKANEVVAIDRLEVTTGKLSVLSAVADGDGNLRNGDLLPSDHQVSVYVLTAVGHSSGYVAQTIYRSAPPLDPEKAGKPPERVKFKIPLSGSDEGTVQTFSGPFKYKVSRVKTGSRPANLQQARLEFPDVDINWVDKTVSVAFLDISSSGHLIFNGHIEVTADVDFGSLPNPLCCTCQGTCSINPICDDCGSVCDGAPCGGRLPDLSVRLRFVVNFDASIINEYTLSGTVFNNNSIPIIPILIPPINIPPGPETGGFGFQAVVGLIGGIELRFAEPMKFRTSLSVGASTTAELSAGLTSGFDSDFDVSNDHASASFEMLELGSTCLQLSVGPGFTGKIYNATCSSLIEISSRPVAGYVEGCLRANRIDETCEKFNIDIEGGLKGDFKTPIGCGVLSVSPINIDKIYTRDRIADFDLGTFRDTAPPVITVPANIVQSTAPGLCSAVLSYAATAEDFCSGVSTFTCAPPTGSTFPKGTTTVNCTATDKKNNTSTSSFNVTINDTEKPRFTVCPGNILKTTDPGQCSAVVLYNPTATDNCAGVSIVTDPPSGFAFPKGTTTVVSTATDASGNVTTCAFKVIVSDGEKPSISNPNITRSTDPNQCSALVTFAPTVADNCPGVAFACSPSSGSVFPKGVTKVTCIATDSSGNTSSTSFNVVVNDTQRPVIATLPGITTHTVIPGDACQAVTFSAPSISDNCPGSTVVCSPPSGSCFPRGATTVNCVVTDASGNTASSAFIVTIFDFVIVDDSTGNLIRFNSATGYYEFFDCRKGYSMTGTGVVSIIGCKVTLTHRGSDPKRPDRSVQVLANSCTRKGDATVLGVSQERTVTIADSNIGNNLVSCR